MPLYTRLLPWQDVAESTDPRTVHGLFVARLLETMHGVLGMSLHSAGEIATPWELRVVRVADLVRCAEDDAMCSAGPPPPARETSAGFERRLDSCLDGR